MIFSILSHLGSDDSLSQPKEDASAFPFLLLMGSCFPVNFPDEVKLASTSSASIWIWSRVRDFLSLKVNPKLDSKAPKNTT